MKEKYGNKAYLIVDTNLDDLILKSKKIYKKDMKLQILGFIASLSVRYNTVPLFCSNDEFTAYIISKICEKANDNKKINQKLSKPRDKKINKQIHLLCGLPNVDETLAKRLLEAFGSVRGVINASEEDWLKIDGIGTKKASGIIDVLI